MAAAFLAFAPMLREALCRLILSSRRQDTEAHARAVASVIWPPGRASSRAMNFDRAQIARGAIMPRARSTRRRGRVTNAGAIDGRSGNAQAGLMPRVDAEAFGVSVHHRGFLAVRPSAKLRTSAGQRRRARTDEQRQRRVRDVAQVPALPGVLPTI